MQQIHITLMNLLNLPFIMSSLKEMTLSIHLMNKDYNIVGDKNYDKYGCSHLLEKCTNILNTDTLIKDFTILQRE